MGASGSPMSFNGIWWAQAGCQEPKGERFLGEWSGVGSLLCWGGEVLRVM